MAVPKPQDRLNNWVVWGDMVESVLVNFEINIWDREVNDHFIEIEHKPTKSMRFLKQIEEGKEETYIREKDTFVKRFRMSMVGHIQPRTEGTYILMLCDFQGSPTSIFEKINKKLVEENTVLRKENSSKNANIIRLNKQLEILIKHPEQYEKMYLRRINRLKITPAVVSSQVMEQKDE